MPHTRPVPTLTQQRLLILGLAGALVVGLLAHAAMSPAPSRQLDASIEKLDSTAKVVRRLSQDLPNDELARARERVAQAIAAVARARAQVQGAAAETEEPLGGPLQRLSAAAAALQEIGDLPLAEPRATVLAAQSTLDQAYMALLEKRRSLADLRAQRRSFWGRLQRDVLGLAGWLGATGTLLSIAVAIVLFMTPPGHLLRPLSAVSWRLRGLTVAGVRVDFDAEVIRSDKTEIEYALNVITTQYRTHYHAAARKHRVQEALGLVVRDFVHEIQAKGVDEAGRLAIDPANTGNFRATLHVPFYIDRHEIIQIAEYVDPKGKTTGASHSAGRVFSQRFGIIGRACRESLTDRPGMPRYDPHVPNPRALEREYGMTKDEAARAGKQRHTFFATPIRDRSGGLLGIFYVDMEPEYGLGGVAEPSAHEKPNDPEDPTSIDHGANVFYAERLSEALAGTQSYNNLVATLGRVRDEVGWDANQIIRPTP
jgi:hypothetical protein